MPYGSLPLMTEYVKMNKKNDTDWFKLTCDKTGVQWPCMGAMIRSWSGTCWIYYKRVKYEFKVEFDVCVF